MKAATWMAGVMVVFCGSLAAQTSNPCSNDSMERARRYVEASDRYLYHDKLTRGMEGYGLTVLEGTRIVRFDVKIVSVMTKWGPQQDVILAKLSGHNLENTGIIAGMSGSPVYVKDKDGKDKLIGAVAYGFRLQKEPLCGIQPITQMIAGSGILDKPTSKPAGSDIASASAGSPTDGAQAPREYLSVVLDPRKLDFAKMLADRAAKAPRDGGDDSPRLVAVRTPLMMSGLSRRSLEGCERFLESAGMIPVQSGGVGGAEAAAAADGKVQLVPGAAIAVPLVGGDADLSAVGTVTEVIDGKVLAFGHSFFGEGEISLPMGNAHVHAVVSSLMSSFKLASALDMTGALVRDEEVAITGKLGDKAATIPMTIAVDWKPQGRRQVFKYDLCKHRSFTPILARMMVVDATTGWRQLPEHHTIRYAVSVDLGTFGKYVASNVSSDNDIYDVVSDVGRPIMALLDNPLGPPPEIRSIDVSLQIDNECSLLAVENLRLDGSVFRPGDTVKGVLTVRPFRKDRRDVPVEFELPHDLKDGQYTLAACDSTGALRALQSEMPQRFSPRTVEQLVQSIQRVVEPQNDTLYLRLSSTKGGLAIRERELPDLPPSKAAVINEAAGRDTAKYSVATVREVPMHCVLGGLAKAELTVQATPKETVIRRANP